MQQQQQQQPVHHHQDHEGCSLAPPKKGNEEESCSAGAEETQPDCTSTTTTNNNTNTTTTTTRSKDRRDRQIIKGEPPRPQCTSTTDSVVVPGLECIHDFITEQEEQALIACLTGPHAPWAPAQCNFSKTGNVKRRVQHYGYVFDYETANVLRDRSGKDGEKAWCPPLPCLPEEYEGCTDDELSCFIQDAVTNANGWYVLAGIIERVRRYKFVMTSSQHPASTTSRMVLHQQSYRFLNQMTVNEYKPGEGIGSHIDTHSAFGDGIMSLSLGAGCVMNFKKHTLGQHNEEEKEELKTKLVYLPARSLLLMSGPARYTWSHQIVTRMTDCVCGKIIPRNTRLSLTLRTAIELPSPTNNNNGNNDEPCSCTYAKPLPAITSNKFPPTKWGDDACAVSHEISSSSLGVGDFATPDTEKNHVHAVYDAIATQWHHTRGKRGVLWPRATRFLKELPKGSIVADVGCGDGKYFPAVWEAGSYVIGTDISEPLLQTCIGSCIAADSNNVAGAGAGPETRMISHLKFGLNDRPAVAVADCMQIPLRSNSCDAAICIAVMHHLSTFARRIRCLQELSRIVKRGGLINVQAWALEQEQNSRRKFSGTDVFVPFHAQPKYLARNAVVSSMAGEQEQDKKNVAQMYSDAYEGAEYNEEKGLVVFQRYCHMYKKGELEELVAHICSLEIVDGGFECGNHFVILRVI
jgi:Alkylated DNA repair protein